MKHILDTWILKRLYLMQNNTTYRQSDLMYTSYVRYIQAAVHDPFFSDFVASFLTIGH